MSLTEFDQEAYDRHRFNDGKEVGIAKDFCRKVAQQKVPVFGADALKGINRKPFSENVFQAQEDYETFLKAVVSFAGTQD